MTFCWSIIIAQLWRPEVARRWKKFKIFFAFLEKDPLRENFQNSVPKGFITTPIHVLCSNFVKFGQREISEVTRYLPDNNTTATVLRPFVWDYPGEPVPEETLTLPPSWSSSNLSQLLPSTTIHSILLVQITAKYISNWLMCTPSHPQLLHLREQGPIFTARAMLALQVLY